MKEFLDGMTLFQRVAGPKHRDLFERLAKRQHPGAVFPMPGETPPTLQTSWSLYLRISFAWRRSP